MARKLKITKNGKYTNQDVKDGEEKGKRWKIQKCPQQDMKYSKKTENHGKCKHPLDDLKNDEITKKREK